MAAPPARLELALAPTPILKLDRLSRRLGVELYVKRDDLTGLLESGNKVRKLEFLVGEALQQGADTLITCGALQSNGCRAVAAVRDRVAAAAASDSGNSVSITGVCRAAFRNFMYATSTRFTLPDVYAAM